MQRFLLAILAFIALAVPPALVAEEAAPAPTPQEEIEAAVDAPVEDGVLAPPEGETPVEAPAVEDGGDNPLADIGEAVIGEGDSTWRTILGTVILIVGTLLTKWLRSVSLSKAKSYEEQAKNAGQDTKQRIVARAKAYIWRRAAEIQEYELPELAAAVVRKQISAEQLKRRLRALGDRLVDETVQYFDRQDIDVVAEFGREQLMSWIRSAVDEISIFQKWPTAKVLAEGGAEAILAVGMDKAGDYYDDLRKKVVAGEKSSADSNNVEKTVVEKIEKSVNEEFAPAPAAGA